MKNLKSFLLIFFIPLFGFAQQLNGIWTGVLSNDSSTIRRDQSFEIALTEYKGKVYGYAYSTFIVNDTLYYILKRVKGTVEGDICEVEDDDVVSHNFPRKPEKKVYVTYTLRRNNNDSTWTLDGNWKTNLTKKYYAISGKVDAKEEKDLSKSKLYEHLGDLNLQQTLVLNKPQEKKTEKKPPADTKTDIAKNKTTAEKKQPEEKDQTNIKKSSVSAQPDSKPGDVAINNQLKKSNNVVIDKTMPQYSDRVPDTKSDPTAVNNKTDQPDKKDIAVTETKQPEKKTDPVVVKTETKIPDTKPNDLITNNQPKQIDKKDLVVTENKQPEKKTEPTVVKTETKPNNATVNNQPKQTEKKDIVIAESKQPEKKADHVVVKTESKVPDSKSNVVASNNQKPEDKKASPEFEFTELKRTNRKLKPASALVDGRESIPSETIFFKSDSLVLALYDNGEVDGDTVSVIINDEMFIDKQGLKSSAFKKTFYLTPETGDSLLVVLFADNLGKYPPNTGLLIVKDGEEQYYVRFKADLDRNAALVLRRKYNP
jgi:hypothetical protein